MVREKTTDLRFHFMGKQSLRRTQKSFDYLEKD